MKRSLTVVIPLLIVAVLAFVIFQKSPLPEETYVVADEDMLDASLIANIPTSDLSTSEQLGLITMREEEKLARDVYETLYHKWGLKIFLNIAESEQTHTDSVKSLLVRYDIEDPVVWNEIGVFTNSAFTDLYNQLVEQGSTSVENALIVGATIEDLDIFDLAQLLEQTDNKDIQTVYQNLSRGSENHMRAFIRQLESRGGSYSARYITESQLNDILGR